MEKKFTEIDLKIEKLEGKREAYMALMGKVDELVHQMLESRIDQISDQIDSLEQKREALS